VKRAVERPAHSLRKPNPQSIPAFCIPWRR
jgi:hypothetical protein